ncbi:MAG: hypothetical protein ACRD21_06365 [Vicinamibacteria bacterium]
MRTTVDIPDGQRARLLEIATRRGDKGFSALVQEAIDLYLEQLANRSETIEKAVAALGSLSEKEAEALRQSVVEIRKRWR